MQQQDFSTNTAQRDYVFTHTANAPVDRVYKAWTDPDRVRRWWGPHDFTNPECELDVRPGGRYRVVMRGPDGIDYPVKGSYQEVEPNIRLVMTDEWDEHPEGWQNKLDQNRAAGATAGDKKCVVTVTFESLNNGNTTKTTIHYLFETPDDRNAMLKMGMAEGWAQSLERLDEILSR